MFLIWSVAFFASVFANFEHRITEQELNNVKMMTGAVNEHDVRELYYLYILEGAKHLL